MCDVADVSAWERQSNSQYGGIEMIINLTPHAVNLLKDDGAVQTFESAGVARASQQMIEAGEIEGVRIVRTTFGAPVNLPDPQEGTFYIVSAITVSSARANGRTVSDLLYTADAVRDEQGRIVGCRALSLAE